MSEGLPGSMVLWLCVLVSLAVLASFAFIRLVVRARRNPLAYQFATSRGRVMLIVFNAVLIVVTLILCTWILSTLRATATDGARHVLESVLRTTQNAMDLWSSAQKDRVDTLAQDPRIADFVAGHPGTFSGDGSVASGSGLEALREVLLHGHDDSGYRGTCIISPTGLCVMAVGSETAGQLHPILLRRPKLLQRVWTGESVLVPPVAGSAGDPVMYVVAPIRSRDGRVRAAIAEAMDPASDFTRIAHLGLIGNTGETYAFDNQGRLLTESRFRDQLVAAGLSKPGAPTILSIELRDPGGPLPDGYRSGSSRARQPLTRMAAAAIRGEPGIDVEGYRDYRGIEVFGAWVWDYELGFGLTTEIDVDDAMETFRGTRRALITILAATGGLSVALSILIFVIGGGANRVLRVAHEEVEQRVNERTRDLEQANTTLAVREERMRTLSNLLNSVLASASEVSIIATDAEGVITIFNAGAERMLGYAANEMVGRRTVETLHVAEEVAARGQALSAESDHAIDGFGVFVEIVKRHGLEMSEWTYVHEDGRNIAVSLVVTTIRDAGGSTVGYLCVAQDISKHNSLVEDLATARDTANAANQAKSAFLATMSHEIRTPMNGVLGSVEVLRQASLTPYQMDLADVIRDSAARLLDIIDDILDFSKIEAGRLEQEHEPVDLTALVESACIALQPVAAKKQVQLSVFVDPQLPARVLADSLRLRQIVTNLVSNAIKFSGGTRSGRVGVEARLTDAQRLRLIVRDNGIGMTTDVAARLFVPFTQADASTTRRYGGSGLGLSIVKRLADIMGGDIAFESAPGAGTTFTVTLPLEPEPVVELPGVDLLGLTVGLVVTAKEQARNWTCYLERHGATVLPCVDAETALSALGEVPPHEAVLLLEAEAPFVAHLASLRGATPGIVRVGGDEQRRAHRESTGVVHLGGVITRGDLTLAVAAAAGRASPEIEVDIDVKRARGVRAPTADEAVAAGCLILVAEDNDLNRKVIGSQLAALGYAAEYAEDGCAALELWRTGRHALLLTDLHMPCIDGYALATAIRAAEGEGEHLPIVMLTANALSGEEARCLAVGMDGYLSKPVSLDLLQAELHKWLPIPSRSPGNGQGNGAAATSQPWPGTLSVAVLEHLLGSNEPELIAEFMADFRDSATLIAGEIRAAALSHSWKGIAAAAHKLKASSRSVGALGLGELCAELEQAGNAGDGNRTLMLTHRFEKTLATTVTSIDELLLRVEEEAGS